MIVALLGPPAGLVLDRLLLQMFEGLVDGGRHVTGLGFTDQGAVARVNGDFGLVAALLDRQDDLGFKFVAQNFADFGKAGFNFLANRGSNFEVPAGEFHVHERPP